MDDDVEALVRLREDPAAGMQETIDAIHRLRDRCIEAGALPEAVPVLRSFLRDADMDVVAWAAQTLGHMGAREAVPDLLDLLRPEAPQERRIAIPLVFEDWGLDYPDEAGMYALRLMKATDTIPDIAACLASKSARTRQTAGHTLRDMHAEAEVARLLVRATPDLRAGIVEFLEWKYIPAARLPAIEAALVSVLAEGDADGRRAAAEALGAFASVAAVMPLLESLDAPGGSDALDAVVRAAIAAIQSRRPGAAPGQVSVSESGQLAVTDDPAGRVSLDEDGSEPRRR